GELEGNSFSLAKILGSDGRTLWFNVVGVGGVDQKNLEVVDGDDFRSANPSLDPMWWEDGRGMEMNGRLRTTSPDHQSAVEFEPGTLKAIPVEVVATPGKWPFPPKPEDFLCAGFFTSPNTWLGLHSTAEVEGEFAPKKFVRRVVRQEDAKQMRRFHRGALDAPVDDRYSRILSMESLGNEEYLNAAFLRMDAGSEPLRLGDPDGALLIYTSAPGLNGTAIIARVDTEGRIIWKVDTGIDRFSLSQILPGTNSMAFVGTRPPVPDKVSEPLLVIVENGTGRMVAHSLWQ
ncbi:MAG: hypothetical protein ABI432_07700, partial [Flavobacteriales bacterium]